MSKKIVAYYRVSTKRQGASGLGLEGQQAAVESLCRQNGWEIVATYTEIESGKRSDRPQLAKALAHSKRARATLVVAKLDRLARNLAFLASLMESGADFVAVDNPTANRLTIHILSAVAEAEGKAISDRTRSALAAYKARGGRLGAARPECRNLTTAARRRGSIAAGQAVRARADEAYQDLRPALAAMRSDGASYQAIAHQLNSQGHATRYGRPWNHVAVLRACRRLGIDSRTTR